MVDNLKITGCIFESTKVHVSLSMMSVFAGKERTRRSFHLSTATATTINSVFHPISKTHATSKWRVR